MSAVGRDDELARIRQHVLDPDRLPGRCLILGEAGAGKTTVWRTIVDDARARGHRVLVASAAEAEWQLSLGVARDLVAAGLDGVHDALPAPQRRLLGVLLLREDPADLPADPGAQAVALLGLIRATASREPVLIAIDDVQWLDAASTGLLSYALRRLTTERVGVLLARRGVDNDHDPFAPAPGDRSLVVRLGTLTLGALGAVLRENLAVPVPRPTLRRVHEAAAANPLLAIELARVLSDPERRSAPGAPLPVPASVGELLRARLEGLGPPALEALGTLATLSSPDVDLLSAALGQEPITVLAPAIEAGIVDLVPDGIRFRHPLLASLAYDLLGPVRQREIHRRLAAMRVDPEERARHLALGVDRPDEPAAAVVEVGARTALARGSPAAAADLAYHAGRLTPPDHEAARHRRALAEIDASFAAGETVRATDRLEALLSTAGPGPERAALLARRARLHHFSDDIAASVAVLDEALAEAGDDDAVRGSIEEGLAWGLMMIRRNLGGALQHARSAAELSRRSGDPVALAEGLSAQALAECLTGRPWRATMDAALAMESRLGQLRATRRPGFAHGLCLTCVGDLAAARGAFEELAAEAQRLGDEASMPSILNHLALVELLAGRWPEAATHLDDGIDRATESAQRPSLTALLGKRSVLAAWRGDHEAARQGARQALDLAAGPAFDPSAPERAIARGGESALWALGHVALVEGRPHEAVECLEPMTRVLRAAGITEPGEMAWLADLVEALVGMGRLDEAAAAVQPYEAVGAHPDREADRATADRLLALLDTARGDHVGARDRLLATRARHEHLDRACEAARTDLALGGVQRRLREQRAARASLEAARAAFEGMGATAWAARAVAELARVGGRAPIGDGLTPTERAVAELVARGRTNRETAAALFLSINTVEAALTAVYGKLGIRSRTELARRIDDPPEVIS